jgi:hypothetical protein
VLPASATGTSAASCVCTVSISPLIAVTVPCGRSRTGAVKAVLAKSVASAAKK